MSAVNGSATITLTRGETIGARPKSASTSGSVANWTAHVMTAGYATIRAPAPAMPRGTTLPSARVTGTPIAAMPRTAAKES